MTHATPERGTPTTPPYPTRKGYPHNHPLANPKGVARQHPPTLWITITGPQRKGYLDPLEKGYPGNYPHPEQTFTRSKSWSVVPLVRQPSRPRARDPRCHLAASAAVSTRGDR